MNISYQWLSELVDLSDISPGKVAEILTQRGLEVEETNSLGKGLEKVVTGQVIEKGKHPNSDRLSLCRVDAGIGRELQIVCGAQNHKTGDFVAVALVGADLPNGMKIKKGVIRDVESEGMLCSEAELGLSKESEGIIILPQGTQVGQPIAQILGRQDTIFTLKLYANQGHFLSHYGVARDLAVALGRKPRDPLEGTPHTAAAPVLPGKNSPIRIELKAGAQAPQFFGCAIDGVKVGPSPRWLEQRLTALGSRSINNVVDATNLVMLELGHPVHAYDATKIEGGTIGVRLSKEGETLRLLDDSEVKLTGTELVIIDGKDRPIGLAGVMGGGNSEVSDTTTKVFLECAEFDPILVRKAKTRHAKQTDAAARFEKGIDPEGLERVMRRLAGLVVGLAGGQITGSAMAESAPKKKRPEIMMSEGFVQDFLGISIASSEVEKILRDQQCRIERTGSALKVTAPSWRLDLNIREDLSEEIARSVGYDKIPSEVPPLSSMPTSQLWSKVGAESELLDRAKSAFVQCGMNEALNYGFSSEKWLKALGFTPTVRVINPLSEEHEWMVPSLLPGLLQNALHTARHHFGSEPPVIRLFEIRPTYHLTEGFKTPEARDESTTGVTETARVSLVLSGARYAQSLKEDATDVDFFDLKNVVESFLDGMGAKGVRLIPLHQSRNAGHPVAKLLHSGKAAEVLLGNQSLGFFGALHPKLAREWKLKAELLVGEFDWSVLKSMCRPAHQARIFKTWGEFPTMERDFAFVVSEDVTAEKIVGSILKAGKPLARSARVFDVYRGAPVPAGKVSVATRVLLADESRSLTEAEAEGVSQQIIAALKKDFGAELRS